MNLLKVRMSPGIMVDSTKKNQVNLQKIISGDKIFFNIFLNVVFI